MLARTMRCFLLDPSSILSNSSLKPRKRMVPVNVVKQRSDEKSELTLIKVNEVEQGNVKSSISNIQIDPNSTRSVNITQEKQLLLKPEGRRQIKISRFTYKVVVEIRISSGTSVLEIPKCKKKAARLSMQRKEPFGILST